MSAQRRWVSTVIGGFGLLLAAAPAAALDLHRSLRQLHHTAWTIENGAPADVWALAQSPDGYLWLGTGEGLFRFDGVRFEAFLPSGQERPPASNITALLATPAGDLWIGYNTGALSRLREGRLRNFSLGLSEASVNTLVQDQRGEVWAALNGPRSGGLARFRNDHWEVVGPEAGLPKGPIFGLLAARDGSVWVATSRRLLVLRVGSDRFAPVGGPVEEETRIAQAPDGRLWLSRDPKGAHVPSRPGRSRGERLSPFSAPSGVVLRRMLFDRDGALWATEAQGGVVRLLAQAGTPVRRPSRASSVDTFSLEDGLSSAAATPVLEDREGDIWVGTNLGLDRFRATNAVAAPGLPVTSLKGFQATFAGPDLYVATGDTLFRLAAGGRAKVVASLPSAATFLETDASGGLWIGLTDRLLRLRGDRLTRERLPREVQGRLRSWLQFPSGVVWISVAGRGVFEQRDARWRKVALLPDPEHPAPPQMRLDAAGRVWIAQGENVVLHDGPSLKTFSANDGLAIGDVEIMARGRRTMLFGGDFGLARFDGRRFESLSSRRFSVLSRISGIVQTSRGDTWLNGISGVVRLSTRDLDDAFDHPDGGLRYDLFDLRDGMPGVAQQDGGTPTALEGPDGRMWFVTSHGVASIDPAHLVRNALPPPVAIRSVIASGQEHASPTRLELPAGVSNLEIDYTALSLSIPERVRFRYQLEGVDRGWINPGARRQAFYTRLGPGSYRFRLIAANNDGVWNRQGDTLQLSIPPTFLQSRWFAFLCTTSGLAALWLLYSMRLRQMAARIRLRLGERLSERERIARELHDTLLQGFQGLVLRFEAAADAIPPQQPARALMQEALDRADGVLVEARDRVLDLRIGPEDRDLSQIFSIAAERLALEPRISFRVVVEGSSRALHPIVRDEVSKIADEVMINALRHSAAQTLEVTITYHSRELRVHFRDDGVGIGPEVLAFDARSRHFGLLGMRERAGRIEADFAISSRCGAGTEIGLTVPARVAYIAETRPALRRVVRRWRSFGS